MTGDVVIRRPIPGEAEALARLHIRCWREAYAGIVPAALLASADLPSRIAAWQRHIGDPNRIVVAGFDGAEPAGLILAGANEDEALAGADGHVAALYVAASHQRLGLGRRLMGAAARAWLERGGTSITLGVLAENHNARRFYESLGGRLARTGTYAWEGHELPDAIYVFDNLAVLAAVA